MFKRLAKRQRRREKEEELGLDDEIKQVLGMHDTDSDESLDSESDSEPATNSAIESPSEEESGDETERMQNNSLKRKRPVQIEADSSSGGEDFADTGRLEAEHTGNDDDDDEDEDTGPPMSVTAAITSPLYDVPGAPTSQDLRACVLCPGKLLKNAKMAKVHTESSAHLRRLQRYTSYVSKMAASPEGLLIDDPREILRDMGVAVTETLKASSQDGLSKRAQRRAAWKAKHVERKKARVETQRKKSLDRSQDNAESPESLTDNRKLGTMAKQAQTKKSDQMETKPLLMAPSRAASDTLIPTSGNSKKHTSDAIITISHAKQRKRHGSLITSPAESTSPQKRPRPGSLSEKPILKRHNTSLYFADDEKNPASPATPHGSAGKSKEPADASFRMKNRTDSRGSIGHSPTESPDFKRIMDKTVVKEA